MICTKSNCKNCEHYRYDEDYGDMACWLKVDTKNKEVHNMTLAERMAQNSNKIQNKHDEVVFEIVNYFERRLKEPSFEEYLTEICTQKDAALKRCTYRWVEFWSYHEGCSSTHFAAPGVKWENPENPNGYQSDYYKGINLIDIQRIVGPKILSLTINRLQELGFSVSYQSDESWLGYYKQKVTIRW